MGRAVGRSPGSNQREQPEFRGHFKGLADGCCGARLPVWRSPRTSGHCAALDFGLQWVGIDFPGALIGLLKIHVNITIGPQEQRHCGKHIADGDRLDERPGDAGRLSFRGGPIGRQRQGLVRMELKIAVVSFTPDRLLNPLRAARCRREKINDQDMHAPIEEFDRLGDELAKACLARLVARRDNDPIKNPFSPGAGST